jgi:hypothetical protein
MSYDLQIWSVREFDPTALGKPELWQHPIESHWIREGASWQISIFRSGKVLPEDVPTEIAQVLPGIQFLTDMSLEGRGTAEAEKLLEASANQLAKAVHGVIFDPQEDTIRSAAGIKRFALPSKQESFSVLRLSWWFLKSPLLSRDGLESFLSMIERLLPEAMPRRYGLYEPPQHIFAETGKAHLLQFMSDHAHEMVVWCPNRPVASFHLGQPETVGATRSGFRTNVLDIEIESIALSQPGWPYNLRLLWRSVSTVLNPIYGEVRTHHGYRRRGGTIFPSMKDDLDVTISWWWRGTPKRLGSAVVLGAEYQALWSDFLSHAALENGLAFASLEDWNSPKDLSDQIGAPPRQISHRGTSAYGGDQEYPEVWPFEEPFNPRKPPSRGTFMSKLRSVFGMAMLVALLFSTPDLCAQNTNAQATYTLKARPKTVAWGYYDAKAAPAQQSPGKPPTVPPAFATVKNTKEFNAVQFGPGNTFAIMKTPPEFQLNEFAISGDGKLLAMGWGSGKIDLWDLQKKKRIGDFKSEVGGPGEMKFDSSASHLLVPGSGGKFAILEIPKGKKARVFVIPLGKFKYDIQQMVIDPSGKWLAYADEESSKVLNLSTDPPKTIANLQDACSVSISLDGTELWTVNRTQLTVYSTTTWESIGHWPLKSPPVATASVRLRTGISKDGLRVVAVPSSNGLVIYRGPGMEGSYATDKSTTTVAFAAASRTYVNLGLGLTFVNSEGTVSCKRSLQGWSSYDVSEDGQWIAVAQTNIVSVWRMDDLLHDCEAGR